MVREGVPDRIPVVDGDRILNGHGHKRLTDVVEVALERELGRVHADDDEPEIPILLGPGAYVRQRPKPVDARVRAEVDDDHFPLKAFRVQGR